MDLNTNRSEEPGNCREKAERKIQFESVPLHRMSDADVAALYHELRVHEVELEMQNEELRRAQVELEQSRSKYADLFDFAPIGYFVFDEKGCIDEVNLTGASMLQKDRRDLLGKPFNLFVDGRDKDCFRRHRQMVFKSGKTRQCEIRPLREEGAEMVVRLRSRPMTDPNDESKVIACRTSITNITALARSQRRLRTSEQRFRTLAENAPDIITRMDRDLRIVYINRRITEATGVPTDQIIGRTPEELEMPEHVCAVWAREVRRVFDTARAAQFEFDYPTNKGVRNFHTSLTPERDEDGTINTVLSVARDVTETKHAKRVLQESLDRLQAVTRATNDGIWEWNVVNDTFWTNEAYVTAFGYTPAEISDIDTWWSEHLHPGEKEQVLGSLNDAVQGDTDTWSARYRIRRKDGSYAWVMDRGCVLRDEQGKALRVVGALIDLSEKLELVDQLETERTKLATVLEHTPGGVVVVDEKAHIVYANPEARRLYSHPVPYEQDFESHAELALYRPDGTPYEPRELPLTRSALDGETHADVEILIQWPDGQRRSVLANTGPLQDGKGKITGAVGIFQDVTELKQDEHALQQARAQLEDQVEQRTTELQQTVETLREEVVEKIEAQKALERQNEILQKIIDNIPVMLCFYDADGDVGLINEEFHRVLGYTLEDFQENEVMELCYPDPRERKEVWQFMMTAEPGWRDFFVQNKAGRKVASSWANVRLSDGSYVGIGIDVRHRKRFENRIKESEERYRTLVELSPDGIGVERDGVIRFVNATARRLLDAEKSAELVGREVLDFIHPDYRRRTEKQLEYLRRRRKPLRVAEAKVVRLDGTVLDVELSAIPIAYKNKPATQIVMRDITQRKEAEARLRDNAIQLQQQAELLDLAHDTILMQDMDGIITFWNQGAADTYGWTKEEAVGRNSHRLLKTRFPSRVMDITAALLKDGRWNGELTHTTRSGKTLIVSSRWALQRDEKGAPAGILEIDRDITQRKRAEQESFEARRFAESVIETIQEALVVLDADLRVLAANRTFYDTFEVTPRETEGEPLYEIGDRQWDLPELRELLEDILPHNSSFEDFEVEHEFEHIGARTMLLNARRIYRQAEQTEMILLAIQDITVRKQQEREILANQQELAELTEELLLTEERERRRIATALHDSIGQCLAFSKRELGVLRKELPAELSEKLDCAKEQIDEAVQQTRSLTFDLSPSTLYAFGLEAAVEELAEQFSQREGFQCRVQTQGADKPVSEQTKVLLYRATRELLINVAKHAAARTVVIRIQRSNEDVRIEVEDDGRGFDLTTWEPVEGRRATFGLFSIRERLSHMNGSFDIQSIPGDGTKVAIQAPLQVADRDT